jgi:hypothetical protein
MVKIVDKSIATDSLATSQRMCETFPFFMNSHVPRWAKSGMHQPLVVLTRRVASIDHVEGKTTIDG